MNGAGDGLEGQWTGTSEAPDILGEVRDAIAGTAGPELLGLHLWINGVGRLRCEGERRAHHDYPSRKVKANTSTGSSFPRRVCAPNDRKAQSPSSSRPAFSSSPTRRSTS